MRLRSAALAAACLGLGACATAQTQPQSTAYADYLIGRVANLRADHDIASDRYFAALTRQPHDADLLEGAVVSSLAAGDAARARRAANTAAATADAPAYALLVRTVDLLDQRDWRSAARAAARVEGTAGEELIARMLAMWAEVGAGRADDPGAAFAPFAAVRPYGGLFAFQQAMALDYAGRNEAALAAYEIAENGAVWLPAAVERHADLLARMGNVGRARVMLSAGDGASNPTLAAASERLSAGKSAASGPLTPARGAAVGLYGLSTIFNQEGDKANALAVSTLALMLDPALDAARLSFAQTQADLGNRQAARAAIAQVAPDSPYADGARVMEAWLVLADGDGDAALAMLAERAEAGSVRALRAQADVSRSLGRYAEAEAIYSTLIAASPENWQLYFARGAARERLGRWPDAEADMRRALDVSPDQPDVLNYLGYSWIDRGERVQEGVAMVQRAVELRPNSGAIVDSLGWGYFRLGDYQRALETLERAIELEPADPTLNDHLGDVYWRLGRRIEARFQWQRALSFAPDNPEPIEAKVRAGLPAPAPSRTARQ